MTKHLWNSRAEETCRTIDRLCGRKGSRQTKGGSLYVGIGLFQRVALRFILLITLNAAYDFHASGNQVRYICPSKVRVTLSKD